MRHFSNISSFSKLLVTECVVHCLSLKREQKPPHESHPALLTVFFCLDKNCMVLNVKPAASSPPKCWIPSENNFNCDSHLLLLWFAVGFCFCRIVCSWEKLIMKQAFLALDPDISSLETGSFINDYIRWRVDIWKHKMGGKKKKRRDEELRSN